MIPYKEFIPQVIKSSSADEYLTKRGIDKEKASKLELLIVPARSVMLHPYIDRYVSIIIPYWTRTGGRTGYWTSRQVENVSANVVTFVKIKEPIKAYNPAGEVPRGYLNPLTNWLEFREGETIFIAESWSKALAIQACGGHKVIGLSGVWNGAPHMTLIPEIADLPVREKKLKFCIVFDSDVFDKEEIRAAMARLSGKIYEKFKVKCEWIPMPHSPAGEKWGFDDMYVLDPVKAAHFLDGGREEVQGTELMVRLVDMNDKVCFIEDQGKIAQLEPRIIMSTDQFTGANYAPWEAVENGKRVSVARAWLKSNIRNTVAVQEYMPECEIGVVTDDDGARKLNIFRGWGCEEKEGNTEIYHDFLRCVIDPYDLITGKMVPYGKATGEEYYLADHILDRFAWVVQNPGKKMNTLTILFGDEGVGKATLMSPWMRIFGENSSQISNEQIRSEFNSMIIGKMLVWIDELKKGKGDQDDLVSQKIRMLVTEKTMVNRLMHQNPFTTRNCINLWVTSNDEDCLRMNDGDRRSLVVHMNGGYDRFRELADWVENGGAEALLYEARRRVINENWDPLGHAYGTPWKKGMVNSNKGWLELRIVELWEDPDSVLIPPPLNSQRRVVYSVRELLTDLYEGKSIQDIPRGAPNAVGTLLEKYKFKKAAKGEMFRNPHDGGRQSTYWIIRREENDNPDWDDKDKCLKNMGSKVSR